MKHTRLLTYVKNLATAYHVDPAKLDTELHEYINYLELIAGDGFIDAEALVAHIKRAVQNLYPGAYKE